jgi:hypothetical protein
LCKNKRRATATTAIYTHLTKPSEDLALLLLNRVVAGLWE